MKPETREALRAFTDDDIRSEINLRDEDRRKAARRSAEERAEFIAQRMTKDAVDIMAPQHGRTSCSDYNLANGFSSSGEDTPRCNRCALLEVVQDGMPWPYNCALSITIGKIRGID